MQKINYIFFGTPDVASETLEILKQAGYLPSLIVTSPDKPQGRKMLLTSPPVKTWAIQNNIPYIQPEDKTELLSIFLSRGSHSEGEGRREEKWEEAELFIVVAYGKIMPEKLIKSPRLGSINIHYSLLPKYRGASPVESAILNGDIETGITIQQMEYKMDTGPILAQEKVAILPTEKAGELRKRLIKIGGELLVKILPDFVEGKITPIPQDESEAINCKKMTKEDGLINLEDDAIKNYNKFRAYATWPRTYFFKDNKRVIITDAELLDGKFIIKKIIPEGGKEQEYKN
ncbi:MAG: methionyl-tRNA formyltransferase [Candidatus Pacebacteria bacterium]|nr:methionyl-tRNA formyltransferase [Candidatus Paceibacterota bacterium]